MRFTGLATVVVLAALVLAGCGDQDSSGASSGATDPTTAASTVSAGATDPTKPAEEGCPYLAAEQVAAALKTPMTETAGSVHACFFDPDRGTGPSVLLSRVNLQIDPIDYATQSRALCQGEVTDVAVGDEAFACMSGMGPQGQMYTHRVLISINVNGAEDDAAGVADAADLLMLVSVPPSTD